MSPHRFRPRRVEPPTGSAIRDRLSGAYFHDCFRMRLPADAPASVLGLYLRTVAAAPGWVDGLMVARNRTVSLLGLKDLGALGAVDPARPAEAYCVGDRVGIFSLLRSRADEVILGDSDRHLDVQVSVCLRMEGEERDVFVTTVVHVRNLLGRLYMLPVAPVHRRIVPAMLVRAFASSSCSDRTPS